MKLLGKQLEKDNSGSVSLIPEDSEDMWHLYNLILCGDQIKASTIRRVQSESTTGSVKSTRMRFTLALTITGTEFDAHADPPALRIAGRILTENEHLRVGSYHTMVVEVNQKIVLTKPEWDLISLERIEEACDVASKAEIGAVVLQEGLANVCLMTENMTVVKQRIEVSIPKKRRGTTTQYDKGLGRFFDQIMQAMLKNFRLDQLKVIIIASPGFLKDQLYKHLMSDAANTTGISGNSRSPWQNVKSKLLLVHSSSGHKHALQEILADPSIQRQLSDTKYSKEIKALDEFFTQLNTDPDRAFYGLKHVQKAAETGAISALLLSDDLFRSKDVAVRKQYIALVEQCRQLGAKVHIFSSLHVSGEQLSQLTGVAAILSYPCPDIEDDL